MNDDDQYHDAVDKYTLEYKIWITTYGTQIDRED